MCSHITKRSNPHTTCAGQFVNRSFVVLLRKRFPQNYNLQTAVVRGVIKGDSMKNILVIVLMPLLFSCKTQDSIKDPYSFGSAKQFAVQQWKEHKDDEKYANFTNEWLMFNNTNSIDSKGKCYLLGDNKEEIILVQNQLGTIQYLIAENENEKTQCFREAFVGQKYPRPPFAPFFHQLTMNAQKRN
jgi:hypothetical protein